MRAITNVIAQALLSAFMLAVVYGALAGLTPDRKEPAPPKKMPPPPPYVGGPCNWGTILQDGRKIEIRGHSHWEAVGRIRLDGKLEVLWTRLHDGALCPGLYKLNADGSIKGRWAEGSTGAKIGDDGELDGPVTYDETVRAAKAE